MTSVLAIGIDPATHSGLALVRLDMATGEAELVGVWPVYGESWRTWGVRAMAAASGVAQAVGGQPVIGWYERPAPARVGDAAWNPCPMSERAGALILALQVAGAQATMQPVPTSQWTAWARVPAGKRGDGSHRTGEAAARIGGAALHLAALEHCRIDCAEAALIALACARAGVERLAEGQQMPLGSLPRSGERRAH